MTRLLLALLFAGAALAGTEGPDPFAYEDLGFVEDYDTEDFDIEWGACTSLQECSFVATQACWTYRVDVEMLSFDASSTKNGCTWTCGNDRSGRVDCKSQGTAQKPRCPESWCEPEYMGPRHPCCDAPDDDDAAKIEWLLPGGWK